MLYTIYKGSTTVRINDLGAELKSFKINGNELIWQANPSIWASSAPILFPFVGRLKEQKYSYKGRTYEISKHGFARGSLFTVDKVKENALSMSLSSNSETLKVYPFVFKLEVLFILSSENKLEVKYTVKNTGQGDMYFCFGSHPGFNLFLDKCSLEDNYIEFEQEETRTPYKLVNGLCDLQSFHCISGSGKTIRLSKSIFNEDALIYPGIKSRNIYIKSDKSSRVIKFFIDNAPDLGIWAKPGAPYVCLEPWFGFDDPVNASGRLEEKPGIISLEAGNEFKTSYTIEFIR